MPVRSVSWPDSGRSIVFPPWASSRSASRSALKPSRMNPPSRLTSGHSSAKAMSSVALSSGHRSTPASNFCSNPQRRAVSFAFSAGSEWSVPPQEAQIARTGPSGRHPGQQSFDVVNAAELPVQVGAERRIIDHFADRIEPGADCRRVGQGDSTPIRQASASPSPSPCGRAPRAASLRGVRRGLCA